ncbi:MAG TPA: hypothetical protein DEA08_06650 [Planctomycetes bacterium]|nr:hypothetical protein [Planctomycetota bacterium]
MPQPRVRARSRKRRRPRAKDLLFIGTRGFVRALSKRTGRKVWETSLPGTGYEAVSLVVDDETVFAASRGKVIALEAGSGEVLWENGLRGLGYEFVTLAVAGQQPDPTPTIEITQRDEEEDA